MLRWGGAEGAGYARLGLEHLEDRTAPAITTVGVPDWVEQGPGPILANPNVVNSGGNRVSGAVEAIAPHPTNANILYIGTTGGGVWKTTNATAASKLIDWVPLTDHLESLSISALALSPLAPDTMFAGTGQLTGQNPNRAIEDGGPEVGLYRSRDGGATWVNRGNEDGVTGFRGETVVAVAPTRVTVAGGQVVFVGTMDKGGLYQSLDGGDTWDLVSGFSPVPTGDVSSIAVDPNNPNRVLVGIAGQLRFGGGRNVAVGVAGIYEGTIQANGTVLWAKRDSGITQSQLDAAGRVEISIGAASGSPFVVGLVGPQDVDQLIAVYRSTNGGGTWRRVQNQVQTNPASDGSIGFAILADRTNANVFFISGDRVTGFPFNGNAYRVVVDDATNANDAWTPITENLPDVTITDAAPHNNTRALTFDAAGYLVIGNDGGLARFGDPDPVTTQRPWISLVGDLAASEALSVGYDDASNRIFGGSLRAGGWDESATAPAYVAHSGGFGELVNAADTTSRPTTHAYRYGSQRTLNSFVRRVYDRAGNALYPRGFITFLGQVTNQDIQINTPVPHGLSTGDLVRIEDVVLNTQANNRNWLIRVLDLNTFELLGSSFNGTFGNSGRWRQVEGVSSVGGGSGGAISVTSSGPHGLFDGASVTFQNVAGNSQIANGQSFVVTVVSPTVFLLNGTTFDGTPGGGGVFYLNHPVLLRASVGGANFSGIQETVPGTGSIPFALNAVDPRRMLIGLTKVYEDADPNPANGLAGDVIADVSGTIPDLAGTVTALAYGGFRAGLARPDVAFVATTAGRVYFRNEMLTAFSEASFASPVGNIRAMAIDPDDWRRVYVIADSNPDPLVTTYRVFMTPNIVFQPFADVSNNLARFTSDPRTILLWDDTPNIDGDAVPLVGGYGGVFRMLTGAPGTCLDGNPNAWSLYGDGLPYAAVNDLTVSGNRLLAATQGRGVWEIADVSTTIRTNAVLTVTGTALADPMALEQVAANHRRMRVSDGLNTEEFDSRLFETVRFQGLAGADTVSVRTAGESGDDLQWVDFLLDIDGGGGGDRLVIDAATDFTGRVGSITTSNVSGSLFGPCGMIDYAGVGTVDIRFGQGNDRLRTPAATQNTWDILTLNGGTITSVLNVVFSGAENLEGGGGKDNFVFGLAGAVDGNIAGGGSFDTLDYRAVSYNVSTNLQTGKTTSVGGTFSQIEALFGGTGNDTLTGANKTNLWTLTQLDPRSVSDGSLFFQFSNIENLIGGTNTDRFVFKAGATLAGNLDGAAGTDTLDYAGYNVAVTVDLGARKATGVGGLTTNFENLVGSPLIDTLVGEDNNNAWEVSAPNQGSVDGFTFSAVESLTGGDLADVFRFLPSGRVGGDLDGGAGLDQIDLSELASMRVNLTALGATDGFEMKLAGPPLVGGAVRNMNGVIASKSGGTDELVNQTGRSALWTFTGPRVGNYEDRVSRNRLAFTNFEFYTGGAVTDTFRVATDDRVPATIDGGAGDDRIEVVSTAIRNWVINAADVLLDDVTLLRAVENILGGAGRDVFLVPALDTVVRTIDGGEAGPDLVDLKAHAGLKVIVTRESFPPPPVRLLRPYRLTTVLPTATFTPPRFLLPVDSQLLGPDVGTIEAPEQNEFRLSPDSARVIIANTSLFFAGFNRINGGRLPDRLTIVNQARQVASDVIKPDGSPVLRTVAFSGLARSLTYNGGGGADRITVVGTELADVFDVRLNTVNLIGKVLTFVGAEVLDIFGGGGNDRFLLTRASYAVGTINVYGQAGVDFVVTVPSLTTLLRAFGSGDGDTLQVPRITGLVYPKLPFGTRSGRLTFGTARRPIEFFNFDRIVIAGSGAQFLP